MGIGSVSFFTTAKRRRPGEKHRSEESIHRGYSALVRRASRVPFAGKQGLRRSTTIVPVRLGRVYRLPVHINCFHNSDRAYVIQGPCSRRHLPRGRASYLLQRPIHNDPRSRRRLFIPTFRKRTLRTGYSQLVGYQHRDKFAAWVKEE